MNKVSIVLVLAAVIGCDRDSGDGASRRAPSRPGRSRAAASRTAVAAESAPAPGAAWSADWVRRLRTDLASADPAIAQRLAGQPLRYWGCDVDVAARTALLRFDVLEFAWRAELIGPLVEGLLRERFPGVGPVVWRVVVFSPGLAGQPYRRAVYDLAGREIK